MVEVNDVVLNVDAEPEPQPEAAQPEPEPEPATRALVELPWTAHNVGGVSKKKVVEFLQKHAPLAFLEERKLRGQPKAIAKKSKQSVLVDAYSEVPAEPRP